MNKEERDLFLLMRIVSREHLPSPRGILGPVLRAEKSYDTSSLKIFHTFQWVFYAPGGAPPPR